MIGLNWCTHRAGFLGLSRTAAWQCTLAAAIDAKLIVLRTETGSTALLHAKYRPNVPIIALTTEMSTARQLLLSRNVTPIKIDSVDEVGYLISDIITRSKRSGLVQPVPAPHVSAAPHRRD